MAVTLFVLFWVVVGLGILFVALSGGPKGARQRVQSRSRRGRRGLVAGFVVLVALLGVAVPVAVIAAVDSRADDPGAGVYDLTPAEKNGREIFAERCRNCHSLKASNAVAQVGPNLDDLRPPKGLVLDAIKNGRARGNGQMAEDLVVGKEADDVAAYVAKAVGQTGQPPGQGGG
jgi:mono/diheme cytochrome c family protein